MDTTAFSFFCFPVLVVQGTFVRHLQAPCSCSVSPSASLPIIVYLVNIHFFDYMLTSLILLRSITATNILPCPYEVLRFFFWDLCGKSKEVIALSLYSLYLKIYSFSFLCLLWNSIHSTLLISFLSSSGNTFDMYHLWHWPVVQHGTPSFSRFSAQPPVSPSPILAVTPDSFQELLSPPL